MLLRRLSPFDGADKWREMWNNEVIPYIQTMRLIAGRGIRLNHLPAGTVIETLPHAGKAPLNAAPIEGYNSYFKISVSGDTESGYTATISDGATGGNSIAVVNGYTVYQVEPYSEVISQSRLFFLKFTPPGYYFQSGTQYKEAVLEIGSQSIDEVLPDASQEGCFYTQIGRVIFNNGTPVVVQDYTAGVADIRWYAACNYNG